MTEPKRWMPVIDDGSRVYPADMRQAENGCWVELEDYDRLRDERDRLAERLREMIAVYDRHSRWCGYYAQAPGDSIIQLVPAARSALAVFDTLTEDAEPEPEPMVFVHEGEDCGGPIVRTLRYGDSVTIQVTGQESYHVRFDDEDTAAMRPFDTLTEEKTDE